MVSIEPTSGSNRLYAIGFVISAVERGAVYTVTDIQISSGVRHKVIKIQQLDSIISQKYCHYHSCIGPLATQLDLFIGASDS
jgi:hypothetical protein